MIKSSILMIGFFAVFSCGFSDSSTGEKSNEDTIQLEKNEQQLLPDNKAETIDRSRVTVPANSDLENRLYQNKVERNSDTTTEKGQADFVKQAKSRFNHSYEIRGDRNNIPTKRIMHNSSTREGSYRLMRLSRGVGALIAMYEATNSIEYLEESADLIDKILKGAVRGRDIPKNPENFKDDYLGWINNAADDVSNHDTGPPLREVPLYESYLFRYMVKMAYIVLTSDDIDKKSRIYKRAENIHQFVARNGWEKWYVRGEKNRPGCYPYLFRNRTHMTSHWAIVALFLRELTDDSSKIQQYTSFLELYDKQLRDNFKVTKDNAYLWNSTWDSPWPYNSNCNKVERTKNAQDVIHGNHVVTYIIEAYQMGLQGWGKQDISRLVNTVKFLLYDKKTNTFWGDLKGQVVPTVRDGIQFSDGFVKLSRYDQELLELFNNVADEHYVKQNPNYYEPQYVAEIELAKAYLTKGR